MCKEIPPEDRVATSLPVTVPNVLSPEQSAEKVNEELLKTLIVKANNVRFFMSHTCVRNSERVGTPNC
jgi:hypothetical protein